jgi:hypothetical protein
MTVGIELDGAEERFNVKDGQRNLTFMGWQVAAADSQSGQDVRWTELTLYKTLTGKYVLEKVGRSDVFHSNSCERKSKGVKFDSLEEAAEDNTEDPLEELFVPCNQDRGNGPHCNPSYDASPVWVERDISAATVLETAEQVVESLFRRESNNTRFLSRVSRALLEDAAKNDPDIKRVISVPNDVT